MGNKLTEMCYLLSIYYPLLHLDNKYACFLPLFAPVYVRLGEGAE